MGGGRLGPGPVHLPRPGLEGVGEDQLPHGVVDGVAGEHGVVGRQRQLEGGAADVGLGHERVLRVDDRRFQRPGEQLGGVIEVPAVELVVAGHEDGGRGLEGPPGPARLLPERSQGAGEALEDDGVEAGHVDAELQGVGGGHTEELALREGRLQLPAFLGEVAAPVGGHRLGQRGPEAAFQPVPRLTGDELGAAPARREGDRPQAAPDHVGQQPADLGCGRGPPAFRRVDHGPVEEGHRPGPPGRPVVVDGVDGQPAQLGGQGSGVADGGAGKTEGRLGAVVEAHPPQPAEEVGDVAAEDPPQRVEFVDDDVAQPHEERRPAVVVGEDPGVEHLGVGEHDVGRPPERGPLLHRRVAVVGHRPHPRHQPGP